MLLLQARQRMEKVKQLMIENVNQVALNLKEADSLADTKQYCVCS